MLEKLKLEEMNVSVKFALKALMAVIAATLAWLSLKGDMSSLIDTTADVRSVQALQSQQLTGIDEDQRAMRHTQMGLVKELGKVTECGLYTVKEGDTLWSVADKLHIHHSELRRLNEHIMEPEDLVEGMILKYPKNGDNDE